MRLGSVEQVVKHLRKVRVRLKPSPIDGIGVFALCDIDEDEDPFEEKDLDLEFIRVPLSAIKADKRIPTVVKKMVRDMCSDRQGMIKFPRCGLNGIMSLYYLNHSDQPNMYVDEDGYFRTIRAIQEGEELTIDYHSYSDETSVE